MSKETRIQEYRERIQKAENEIKFCNNEIDELSGLTKICPNCEGEGKIMTVHRTFSPHGYMSCYLCRGKGKITKEVLQIYKDERIEGMSSKEYYNE